LGDARRRRALVTFVMRARADLAREVFLAAVRFAGFFAALAFVVRFTDLALAFAGFLVTFAAFLAIAGRDLRLVDLSI